MLLVVVRPAPADPSTAKWLVDLGRDYPLTHQAARTKTDAELTLAFMKAAARVEPGLAEAYLWQHDVLAAMSGQDDPANVALKSYIEHRPDDVPAQLWILSLAVEKLQTAEQRAELCQRILDEENISPAIASDIDRRLGVFHFNRGEIDNARTRFNAALNAYAGNLIAQESLIALDESQPESVRRARYLTVVLRVSPGRVEAVQELADILVRLGLHAQATEWFDHAARLYEAADPGSSMVFAMLVARARALVDANRLDDADQLLAMLRSRHSDVIDVHLESARLAKKRGNQDVWQEHLNKAAELWNMLGSHADGLNSNLRAEMAWFYVHYVPTIEDAAKLADAVLNAEKDQVVARRALGKAQRLQQQSQAAIQTLLVISDRDGWAALELAQAFEDAGDHDKAVNQLRKAMQLNLNGEQVDVALELCQQWQVDMPATRPALGDLTELLENFPREVLEYPFDPSQFLEFSTRMTKESYRPGEPWRCCMSLKNIGTFPIYFGSDLMISPDIVCRVSVLRPGGRELCGEDIRLSLRGKLYLKPGELIDVEQTLDIGAVRAISISAPQLELSIHATAIVDPLKAMDEAGNAVWLTDVRSVSAKPAAFRRIRFPVTENNLKALAGQSVSSDVDKRIAATQLLAMLLAEQQHVAAGRLKHTIELIDQQMLGSLLLKRVDDSDWRVRVRLTEAMRWFILDKSANAVLTRLLSDKHWLVRGLALRALVDHFGNKSDDVSDRILKPYSKNDSDEWVRQLAGALLERVKRR